jgi:very-short-patch-repair endonuclease
MYRDQEQRDFARELRNQPTDAEKRLWHFLRAGKLGVKFRRQAAIGTYIVDFVCFSHRLIVELDGPQHVEDKGKDHDTRRTAWLNSRGFRVIRFRNQALDEDIWRVVEEIKDALGECEPDKRQPPSPNPPRRGEGAGQGLE